MRPSQDALPIALLRAREVVMARFRPLLAEHGVTEQQWRVIRIVQEESDVDATTLARRCCILMPSLSRILKALEDDGLLARKPVIGDRRRQMITLTNEGQQLFASIAPKSEAIYADIEQLHGADKLKRLNQALADLRECLAQ